MPRAGDKKFSPGFRLSYVDIGVFIAGAIGSVLMWRADMWLGIAIAFVVGHFFLFCNVARMSRPPELVWAATYAVLSALAILTHALSWPIVFGISGVLTVILVVSESQRPFYHGVGWRSINPGLPDWWAKQNGGY